jgi:hypothetical protein
MFDFSSYYKMRGMRRIASDCYPVSESENCKVLIDHKTEWETMDFSQRSFGEIEVTLYLDNLMREL